MTRKEFFEIIRAGKFNERYSPEVTNFYHKLRGMDGSNKKSIDFSDEDKRLMKLAAKKLAKDINNVKF